MLAAALWTTLHWFVLALSITTENTTDSGICTSEPNYCLLLSSDQCYFNPECCKTCAIYEEDAPSEFDCRYGDRAPVCSWKLCANPVNWYVCCKTCRKEIDAAATTTVAATTPSLPQTTVTSCDDVTPGCDVAVAHNGNSSCYYLEKNCCKTCNAIKDRSRPDCPYGDRIQDCAVDECSPSDVRGECCATCRDLYETTQEPTECVDHDSCASVISMAGKYACYKLEDMCCRTCTELRNTEDTDCMYGDRANKDTCNVHMCNTSDEIAKVCCATCSSDAHTLPCTDDPTSSCAYNLRIHDRRLCYHMEDGCCASCAKLRDQEYPACPYGDRAPGCMPDFCANRRHWRTCCGTCKASVVSASFVRQPSDDCKDTRVSGANGKDCATTVSSHGRMVCYDIEEQCCKTCSTLKDHKLPDCAFGDRAPGCEKDHCSANKNWAVCCETCKEEIAAVESASSSKEATCEDKSINGTSCADILRDHGRRICYHVSKRCCKSCLKLEDTSLPNCSFGDRAPSCTANHCTLERNWHACCHTCKTQIAASVTATPATPRTSTPVKSACVDGPLKGTTCTASVAKHGRRFCYHISDTCCKTCTPLKDEHAAAGCEFGDRAPAACEASHMCLHQLNWKICCQTCKDAIANATSSFTTEGITRITSTEMPPTNAMCNDTLVGVNSCQALVAKNGRRICYHMSAKCCKTCTPLMDKETPDCAYGNRAPNCDQHLCSSQQKWHVCCATCKAEIAAAAGKTTLSATHPTKIPVKPACVDGPLHGTNCASAVSKLGRRVCYHVEDTCCKTCSPLKDTKFKGCEYGDRLPSACNIKLCPHEKNWNLCCFTCKQQIAASARSTALTTVTTSQPIATEPACVDEKLENTTCKKAIAKHGRQMCYHVQEKCCKTCTPLKDSTSTECSYGDRVPAACNNHHVCLHEQNWPMCCASCRDAIAKETSASVEQDATTTPVLTTPNVCDDKPLEGITCAEAVAKHGRRVCYHVEQRCCKTCTPLIDATLPQCPYGDRTPEACKVDNVCDHKLHWKICCLTCQDEIAQDEIVQTKCEDNSPSNDSCKTLVSKHGQKVCYHIKDTCCKTCTPLIDNIRPGCAYGDKADGCIQKHCKLEKYWDICCATCKNQIAAKSRQLTTTTSIPVAPELMSPCVDMQIAENSCENIVQKHGRRICYHIQHTCCKSCSPLRDLSSPGCEYGDRAKSCTQRACALPANWKVCCESCKDVIENSRVTADTSNSQPTTVTNDQCTDELVEEHKCSDLYSRYGKMMCYNLEERCCATCTPLKNVSKPDCAYGDQSSGCTAGMCSHANNWTVCCETCQRAIMEARKNKASLVTDIHKGGLMSTTTTTAVTPADECEDVAVDQRDCARELARNGRTICYNIEKWCCKTCKPLKIAELPDDCAYGDRSIVCHTHLCKYEQNWHVCCALCRREIAAARAGHRAPPVIEKNISTCHDGRLSGMTCPQAIDRYGPRLCYEMEDVCCMTCKTLRNDDDPDCVFGDRASGCTPYTCQHSKYWQACCDTCRRHIDDSRAQTDDVTTAKPCTDTSKKMDGYTCPQLVQRFGKRICYHVDDECCATCSGLKDNTAADCAYGDRSDICRDGVCSTLENLYDCCETCADEIAENSTRAETTMTQCVDKPIGGSSCEQVVKEQGARMCYHLEDNCCKTCAANKDSDIPDCPYGDQASGCQLSHCASDDNWKHCCHTCKDFWMKTHKEKLPDGHSPCQDDTTGDLNCQQQIAKQGKAVCYELEEKCCKSCRALKNDSSQPDCAYGDKATWCSDIDRRKCYNYHDTCCDSCQKLAANTSECRYGDRMPRFCQTLLPWECYDYPVACCETCKHARYPDADKQCEFGDKKEAKICSRHRAMGCGGEEAQTECCRTCGSSRSEPTPNQKT